MDPLNFEDSIAQAMREREGNSAAARGNIRVTDGCIPMFFPKEVEDRRASEAAGRPIYRTEDWVQILIPGSKERPVLPVRADIIKKYPEQWESYKRNEAREVADGTPITEWQAIPRTRAAELRAMGFYTVELVAEASDRQLEKMGGGARQLQQQAKAFIDGAREIESERKLRADMEAKFSAQVAEAAELRRELEDMRRRMDAAVGEISGADDQASGAGGRKSNRNRAAE